MRLINLRLSLFCFVAMCVGVFAAVECVYGNVVGSVASSCVFVVLIVLLCLFNHSKWYIALIVSLFVALGFGLTYAEKASLDNREIVERKVTLVGRVSDIGRNGSPVNKLYLEDCKIDGKALRGRVAVTVFDGSGFATGELVRVDGSLRSVYVFKSGVETYNLRKNVCYEMTDVSIFTQGKTDLTFAEKVREYVWQTCSEFADEKSSGVIYALITGDRNAVDEQVDEVFRSAGISHLLAVSGLHVGVVASVFVFFLRRFKMHPAAEFCVVAVPVLLYAYLCGFSPSVVRAAVMLACVYAARLLFGRGDLLTSLSWAGIVLLAIRPLYLYDVGFQLSFLSVLGIATLYAPLSERLRKLRLPVVLRQIADLLAMSLCCTAATTCTLLYVYREATLAGIVINVFAVPMISAAFVIALAGMIPWVFHYLLCPADWLVCSVLSSADFLTDFDFTRFTVAVSVVTVAVAIVWMFVAGGFVNLNKKCRIAANIALAAVFLCTILFSSLPEPCKTQAFVAFDFDEAAVAVMSDGGEAVIVTDFPEKPYALDEVCDRVFGYKTDGITWCVTKFADVDADTLARYVRDGDRFFVADYSGNDDATLVLAEHGITPVYGFANLPMGKGVTVTPLYDGSLVAVLLTAGDLQIADVVGTDVTASNFAYLRDDIDVYAAKKFYPSYAAQNKTVVSMYQHLSPFNLGANKYGNFTITPKDGTINIKFR